MRQIKKPTTSKRVEEIQPHKLNEQPIVSLPPEQQSAVIDNQSYYKIGMTAKVLNLLLVTCVLISSLQAIVIYKQSSIQEKYNIVYALDNEIPVLLVTIIPYLIATIAFLYWKKKSTGNLFVYRGKQSITPAGAVYWYFIPIAWFWKPYEAMKNLVYGFNVEAKDRKKLPIWWAIFWGSIVVAFIAVGVTPENINTEADAELYVVWAMVTRITDAISSVAAIVIVSVVSTAQILVTDNS